MCVRVWGFRGLRGWSRWGGGWGMGDGELLGEGGSEADVGDAGLCLVERAGFFVVVVVEWRLLELAGADGRSLGRPGFMVGEVWRVVLWRRRC